MLSVIQIIVGLPLVLFIPGYAMSYAFFPKKNDLDLFERIALSFGLSISLIPIAVFFMNKFLKIPITVYSNLSIIFGLVLIGFIIWKKRK